MNGTRAIALSMISMSASSTWAANTTTNAELRLVANALRPVLEKIEPKPSLEYLDSSPTLAVNYLVQIYKIHPINMTGEVLTNTYDEVGPSYKGFTLRAHLQRRGEVNQAATPQILQKPYWQTYLAVTPIDHTNCQIYWGLSYSVRTDTNILAEIRRTLDELAAVHEVQP